MTKIPSEELCGCAQWYRPGITALGRLMNNDGKFEVSLSHIVELSQTKGADEIAQWVKSLVMYTW